MKKAMSEHESVIDRFGIGRGARMKDIAIYVLVILSFLLVASKALFNIPAALIAMFGMYLIFRDGTIRSDQGYRYFLVAWLCLWLPMLMSLPDAVNFERSLKTVFSYIKFPLVGAGLIWAIRRSPSLESRVMLFVSLALAAYSVDMLWQLYRGYDLLGFPLSDAGRLTGPSSDDKLAIAMGAFMPLVLESIVRFKKIRWLMLLATMLVAVAILLSGQRGGILSGFVGSGLWLTHYVIYRSTRKIRIFAILALFIVIISTPLVIDVAKTLPGRHAQSLLIFEGDLASIDAALGRRVGLWLASTHLFQQHPINGIGPRGFRFALEKKEEAFKLTGVEGSKPYVATHPHLVILEVAVETGILGIVGYCLFVWWIFRSLRPLRDKTLEVTWACALAAAIFPLNMSMALYGTYWSHIVLLLLAFTVAQIPREPRMTSCTMEQFRDGRT
jgi:O-antigen ligase